MCSWITVVAVVLAAPQNNDVGGGSALPPTMIDQIVMYAIDDDTHELIRYWFGASNAMVIDVLAYPDGTVAADVECLGYLPSGPHKGLYGVDNYDGDTQARLVKISAFTATATAVADLGYGNVEGMVTAWDTQQNQWYLYATTAGVTGGTPAGEGNLVIKWWVGGTLVGTLDPPGTYMPATGSWHYAGQEIGPGGITLDYDVNYRSDLLLSGGFGVTNPTNGSADIVVEVTAPVSGLLEGSTELQGTVALGLTADGGGGTLAASGGVPIWRALIDGAAVGTPLYPAPYELTVDGMGSNGDLAAFGQPNALTGPPALESVGISLGFSITAFDLMSSTGVFVMSGDAGGVAVQNLIRIDPATGDANLVQPLPQRFEGLARAANGVLYASRNDEVWTINLGSGDVVQIGSHSYDDVEALEYAFGYNEPRVHVPGVPGVWTKDGVLFGFSDDADAMVVINPASGEAMVYECGVGMDDLEGIVFMTTLNDPFGNVIANVFD